MGQFAKEAIMEIEWNFITDFGNDGHHIHLIHTQNPNTASTQRTVILDGEEVVNENSNDCKLELDIGDDEIDVVIAHNPELTRYDYLLYINEIEYGDKCNVKTRKTGGTKQTLTTKDISAKELKKKNKKRWEERNKLKVK